MRSNLSCCPGENCVVGDFDPRVVAGGDAVGVAAGAVKAGTIDPPHADVNSMMEANNKKHKRTNLCRSMN